MIDTHESINIRFRQMMMERSSIDRLKMGCSMFEAAKHIVRSSILAEKPQTSPQQIKKEIFLRFYGKDFKPEYKEKILNALK